jgi:hypothetical protein
MAAAPPSRCCHVVATTPRNSPPRDGTRRVHTERPARFKPPRTPRQSMQVRVVPRLSSKRPGKVRIPLGSLEQARAVSDLSSAKSPQRVFGSLFLGSLSSTVSARRPLGRWRCSMANRRPRQRQQPRSPGRHGPDRSLALRAARQAKVGRQPTLHIVPVKPLGHDAVRVGADPAPHTSLHCRAKRRGIRTRALRICATAGPAHPCRSARASHRSATRRARASGSRRERLDNRCKSASCHGCRRNGPESWGPYPI